MEKQRKQVVMADAMDIMKILPHRYPMLLIDAIIEYEAGAFAVGRKRFSYNEPYFQGHYPKQPIVPGTILLEGLSQAASFAILSGEIRGGQPAVHRSRRAAFLPGGFPRRLRYLQGRNH